MSHLFSFVFTYNPKEILMIIFITSKLSIILYRRFSGFKVLPHFCVNYDNNSGHQKERLVFSQKLVFKIKFCRKNAFTSSGALFTTKKILLKSAYRRILTLKCPVHSTNINKKPRNKKIKQEKVLPKR